MEQGGEGAQSIKGAQMHHRRPPPSQAAGVLYENRLESGIPSDALESAGVGLTFMHEGALGLGGWV